MDKYYITVKITYVDYERMTRDTLKIRRGFNEAKEDAELGLQLCIHDFYSQHENCDIIGVEVLDCALFGEED